MRKSIWTTLFGLFAALPNLIQFVGIESFGHLGNVSVDQALSGLGILGLGFMAKDRNATGGTVPVTPEAARRVGL